MDDQGADQESGGRLTIFWLGARRGMKFGTIACVAIWVILNCVTWVGIMFLPTLREQVDNYFRQHSIATAIGALVVQLVLMVIVVAIPIALITGLVSLVRSRRSKPVDSGEIANPAD